MSLLEDSGALRRAFDRRRFEPRTHERSEPMRGHPQTTLHPVKTTPVARWRARDRRGLLLAVVMATLAIPVAGHELVSPASTGRVDTRPAAGRQPLAAFPIAARAPVSAALGAHEPGYRVVGLRARNPRQRLTASFSRAGLSVASGTAHLRLKLIGYGHGSALRDVGSVAPHPAANRVDYVHRGVDEWYANGPLGLEQGFDVSARPTTDGGPLSLSLAFSSNARASVERSGIVVRGHGGELRYSGLAASDARGRSLHSWLQVRSGRLLIHVDDRGAAYPVRIDPLIQAAELTASDGAAGDALGLSAAVSGDTIVASAPFHDVGTGAQQGVVYVFVKPASGWANATQTAQLRASDAGPNDVLSSVSISGDTIVAGAAGHHVGANSGQGAVYVFVKPASGWTDGTQTAELTASDGATNESLGNAVSISGDTVVATAPGHKVGDHAQQGAAYVFVKPVAGWANATQTAELTASDGVAGDSLNAVSISGDTIVAGASLHQVGANKEQGAGYVFVKPDSGWVDATQTAELTSSDGAAGDLLGLTAAISGDTVALGAPFHQVGLKQEGAAYVFVKTVLGWSGHQTQNAELTPSDGATNDRFGASVGVSGNSVIVGSIAHQVGANPGQGAAYLFTRPGNTWTSTTEAQELTAADGATSDLFGDPVAISGNVAVVGAPLRPNGTARGAVYVFGLPPTTNIVTPTGGASFTQGRIVRASYSCTAPSGATITACSGPVPSGAPIDTATLGRHSFTVTVVDTDGIRATRTVTYNVLPPAPKTTLKPSITALRQSVSTWREPGKLPKIARRPRLPIGTTFSFALNQPTAVTFSFSSRSSGRRVHGRCVKRRIRNEHAARCTRTIAAGGLRLTAHAGADRVHFAGRISRAKKLPPGTYTLRVTATDTAGQSTSAHVLRFTIVK